MTCGHFLPLMSGIDASGVPCDAFIIDIVGEDRDFAERYQERQG